MKLSKKPPPSWRYQGWRGEKEGPRWFSDGIPDVRRLAAMRDWSYVVNAWTGFKCAMVTPAGERLRSLTVVESEEWDAGWRRAWAVPCGRGAVRRARRLAERTGCPVFLVSRRRRIVAEFKPQGDVSRLRTQIAADVQAATAALQQLDAAMEVLST